MRENTAALRLTSHFLQRFRERLPNARVTEGDLSRGLADAGWYAGGGRSYYALQRIAGHLVVLVVEVREGLIELITIYEPKPDWDRRLGAAKPWPMTLVLAASA